MGSKKRADKPKPQKKTRVSQKPLKKNYNPFEDWVLEHLMYLVEHKELLSPWEKEFVKDRGGAFEKFGWNAVITDKQIEILKKLYKSVKFKVEIKKL